MQLSSQGASWELVPENSRIIKIIGLCSWGIAVLRVSSKGVGNLTPNAIVSGGVY